MTPRLLAVAVTALLAAAAPAAAQAPGAPGTVATWTEGDKDGAGTSTSLDSKVLFTLDDGRMTEAYFPDLGTPSVRDLQFAVTDGRTFTERETDDASARVELIDRRSLSYRQVTTARSGRWRITKTYTTDPRRSAVLVDVELESLTGRPYELYALLDPALTNGGDDDRGARDGDALVAWDASNAVALATSRGLGRASSGYAGASDGWTDLSADHRLDATHDAADAPGNVQQIARMPARRLTVALGFGRDRAAARRTARRARRRLRPRRSASTSAAGRATSTACGARAACAAWRRPTTSR